MTLEQRPANNAKRRHLLWGLAAFFLVIGIISLLYWLMVGQYNESTDDAYVAGNNVQVMSQISGHVVSILADETDAVKKGNPVVMLDSADAEIALETAKDQLAVTTREVRQYYDNVNQLKENVQLAQDNLQRAKEDYERREGLVANKTISIEDLRHAKITFDAARDAFGVAKQQLASAIALVGNTDLYHHPRIQQGAVNLRNAFLNWRRIIIYAPATGYVAKRPVQVGQQINTNTVLMTIIPLDQIWVDANFKESQLKNIRIGQPAELISDAYGRGIKYRGKVIGFSPGTGSAFDLLPPQNATGNWIKIIQRLPIRIQIDPKQLIEHPLRIGLSMTVTINTHDRQGGTLTQQTQPRIIYQSTDYSSDLKEVDLIIENILKTNAENVTLDSQKSGNP